MRTKRITPLQKRILAAMLDGDTTIHTGDRTTNIIIPTKKGEMVRVYTNVVTLHFLRAHGWVTDVREETQKPVYRLTEKGRRAALTGKHQ